MGQRAGAITLSGNSGRAQQLVGDLGHGADTNDGLLAQGHGPGDDGRGTAMAAGSSTDVAKLHDYEASCEFTQAC